MEEESYRITPKGILAATLGIDEGERVWGILMAFCQKRLNDQQERGIPCLIMKDGGYVISADEESSE